MKLSVLLIGSGGREHALAWKIRQSPLCGKLFVAPGNGGTETIAENVPIKATDIVSLLAFAIANKIDLTVVGPEDPLAMGIVDLFRRNGLKIFGPTQAATEIEASKSFAKGAMRRARVQTARSVTVSSAEDALIYLAMHPVPKVLKADGLAGGKGAFVCMNDEDVRHAIDQLFIHPTFGPAASQVVIEDFLAGEEFSLHALTDGFVRRLFPAAQDHKRAFDRDRGPNTGGMGTIAPVPWVTPEQMAMLGERIVQPILREMDDNNRIFTGLLFPGIMNTFYGPRVLEFNARFGDPETQVYMRLMESDILPLLMACAQGTLRDMELTWNPGFAACVVLANEGYPESSSRDVLIEGLDDAARIPGVEVFHGGTKTVNGRFYTNGGRIFGVTGVGPTLQEAIDTAYTGIRCIRAEGTRFRTDIGARALAHTDP